MVETIETKLPRRLRGIAVICAVLAAFAAGAAVTTATAGASSGGAAPPAIGPAAAASTSGLSVALDATGRHQYVLWRGLDGRIWEARYGGGWRGPLATPWFTASTPGAAVDPRGVLYVAWRGSGDHIFEATYDGRWHAAKDLTKAGRWRTKGQRDLGHQRGDQPAQRQPVPDVARDRRSHPRGVAHAQVAWAAGHALDGPLGAVGLDHPRRAPIRVLDRRRRGYRRELVSKARGTARST